MKKIILVFLFIILYSLFFIHPAYAVTKTDGDLQVTYDEPLFPSTIIWYPGLSVQKSFTVKNIGGSTHKTSLKADNTSQTGSLADNLYLKISEGATDYYGGADDKTMKNFWDNGETGLSDISGGNNATYSITITMPGNLGNEFQGKTAKFDLVVGFVGTPSTVTISGGGAVAGAATVPYGAFIPAGPAPGFAPGVLGVATPEAELTATPTATITGQIQGIQTSLISKKLIFGITGLLGGIALLAFYLRRRTS